MNANEKEETVVAEVAIRKRFEKRKFTVAGERIEERESINAIIHNAVDLIWV